MPCPCMKGAGIGVLYRYRLAECFAIPYVAAGKNHVSDTLPGIADISENVDGHILRTCLAYSYN